MTKRINYTELLERLSLGFIATAMSTVIILLLIAVNGDYKLKILQENITLEHQLKTYYVSVEESIKRYIDSLPIPEPIEIVEKEDDATRVTVLEEGTTGSTEVDVEHEIYLLAKGIHGEASICDREEKYKVGTVIMNRVASSKYPNTVEGVLSQPSQYSCYQDSRWYTEEPSKEELEIARDIYSNGTRVYGPEVIYQSKTCDGKCVDKTRWHEYGTD